MIYIIAIVVLLAVWFAISYNGFITSKARMSEALSDIDVQSKRRYDLIPNLVETVKGYASQEKTVLEDVTKARAGIMTAGADPLAKAQAENALSSTLKTLFAVSESYPDLKSNQNFLQLQNELTDTEDKMQAARRFYNSTVRDFNVKVASFPSNMLAGMFGFKTEPYFEVETPAEKQPVQVKF